MKHEFNDREEYANFLAGYFSKKDNVCYLNDEIVEDYPDLKKEYEQFGEGYYQIGSGFIGNPSVNYIIGYDNDLFELND